MDVYQVITGRIIEKLEQGTVPWHKPWRSIGAPRNLASKKPYRGVNVWLLAAAGYTSPYWATIRQINELGGHIRKGEKATPVVFWRIYVDDVEVKEGNEHEAESEQAEGQGRRRFVLRYYSVFNTEQCELPATVTGELALPEERTIDPIEACEKVLAGMPNPPTIQHAGDKAFYSPMTDRITMPPRGMFESAEEYWSSLWHETGHATGHEKRLARPTLLELAPFGTPSYSVEEIVAEMTASFLCGVCGIANRTVDNSAAYIGAWLRRLHDDRKLIVHAAAQAQRACDYILNATPQN